MISEINQSFFVVRRRLSAAAGPEAGSEVMLFRGRLLRCLSSISKGCNKAMMTDSFITRQEPCLYSTHQQTILNTAQAVPTAFTVSTACVQKH